MMDTSHKEQPIVRAAMQILWPGFVAAIALVGVLFSLVDPQSIEIVQDSLDNSREAAYTLSFLICWAIVSAACAMTRWLSSDTSR